MPFAAVIVVAIVFFSPVVLVLGMLGIWRGYLLQKRELEIRRLEVLTHLQQGGPVPAWVHRDAASLREWDRAVGELDEALKRPALTGR